MLVGYARSSTVEQKAGLIAQHDALSAVGCERTFSEQVSSVGKREQIEEAISFARDGDTFIIRWLDRLARSTQDLLGIVERLDKKGVALRILDFAGSAIDTSKAVDKLLITVFGPSPSSNGTSCLSGRGRASPRRRLKGSIEGEPPRHAQRRMRFGRSRRRDSQRVRSPTGLGSASGVCSGCWRWPAITGLRSAVHGITEGE